MKIRKETIDALKKRGIDIRWYAESTYEEFKQRMWQEEYDFAYNYNKRNVRGSKETEEGWTNVLFESVQELEEHSKQFADIHWQRHADPYNFETLYIIHDDGKTLVKKESVKSKEITEEYVLKLVEANRKRYNGTYGKFALAMQKLCKEKGLIGCNIYPTTYGIGVWVFWNRYAEENIKRVEDIMRQLGIEYYNEFSDARFVYRFKVSKKKENIERAYL